VGKRIVSTIVLWSLVAAVIYFFGRDGSVVLLALFAATAQYELYRMLEKLGQRPFRTLGITLGVLLILMPYFLRPRIVTEAREGLDSALVAITIVACCLRVMRERTGPNRLETLIATVFGLVYVPFMLFFLVRILWIGHERLHGIMFAVWLLFAAKFCDVGALLVGSLIGKHKMAPSMSPAKTWEGAIGGVCVAVGMCAALVAVVRVWFPEAFPPEFTPLISGIAAIAPAAISITSDLIESVIKRMSGMKDSGKTFPGIGGAFDLVDSLILAAPVGFLVLRVLVSGQVE
jgi:phosphatidate cytidylyltransferase